MRICLDAGHYGKYNQSPVNPAYWESEFTWKFHLLLKAELERHGFEVTTTRSDQTKDLDVCKRGQLAKGCDLFLSIHSNACADASVDYPLACCCVSGQADVLGHELAEIVGKVMGTTGVPNIMKRKGNGGTDYYGVLRGAASVGVPGILLEHSFHTNRRATEWLMNDTNLQRMAAAEAEVIAAHFGVSTGSTQSTGSNAKSIWDKLTAAGLTEAGAAGMLGNLKAESDLDPCNVQNTAERKLGYDDRGYTEAVDFGSYPDFANDGAGYGLAQWTYPARKAALLEFAKAQKKSVGDLDVQLDFLLHELRSDYPALLRQLCAASDVRAASDAVLTQFERPADISESVKIKRAGFAEAFLREFGGQAFVVNVPDMPDIMAGVLTIDGKSYAVRLRQM
ncbi:MAG: N-acetylmuramoyl-L-alanine amidase [Oscillospiraceae bacterium]|nr:N-acetylmuramoyl-L-alanine amidase [Oscillospiraceae bacterium]